MPGPEQLPGVCRSLGAFRTESGDGMLVSEYLPGRVPVTPLLLLVDVGYCWLIRFDNKYSFSNAIQFLFNEYEHVLNWRLEDIWGYSWYPSMGIMRIMGITVNVSKPLVIDLQKVHASLRIDGWLINGSGDYPLWIGDYHLSWIIIIREVGPVNNQPGLNGMIEGSWTLLSCWDMLRHVETCWDMLRHPIYLMSTPSQFRVISHIYDFCHSQRGFAEFLRNKIRHLVYTVYVFVIFWYLLESVVSRFGAGWIFSLSPRQLWASDTGGDLFDIAAKLGEPGYDREQQAKRRRF